MAAFPIEGVAKVASENAWANTRDTQHIAADEIEALTREYHQMVEDMRTVFNTGKTKDLNWRRTQLTQIQKMIAENHEAITAAVRADLGGPKLRGIGELSSAADAAYALQHLDEWASPQRMAGVFNKQYVRPEPKGVVLNVAPWNYPFNMCLQPLVPAIAAGNCMVIKPSELAPNCAQLIASLVKKYLDNECVKVVLGAVAETTALLKQRWDHMFYTGNGAIGRLIMTAAAKHLTPVTLELGGKSPCIIDETAQMDAACSRIAMAKWLNQGQTCVAPDYVLIHESRAKEFIQRSGDLVKKAFGNDPKASEDWGYIISERHVDRVKHLIETSGGEIVCGGTVGIDKAQRHVPPTIIKQTSLDAPIMHEEIFGPVLPVLTYKTLDEALQVVTSKETPLALYVFSENKQNIEKVLSTANSGGSCVNSAIEHLLGNEVPFGGKGASGMGSYHGKFGFDEFSHQRAVLYKTTLPGARGPAFPLPVAGKPLPPFVYDLAVKMTATGFVPENVKKGLKVGGLLLAGGLIRSRL